MSTSGSVVHRFGRSPLRGTFARTGGAGVHLLSALTHQDGTVLAQQQVDAGTSEITWMQPLLDGIDLAGVVVTADALHTTRALVRYLTRRDPHYVLTVKGNQHRLRSRLTALPWPQATRHTSTGIGHGRLEQRTIETLPAPDDLDFPATTQVSQITRYRADRTTGTRETHTGYGITSPAHQHQPRRHRHPPTPPLGNREPAALGPRHHLPRRPLPRPHSHRPRAMATLRNLAISTLHATGHTSITRALRHMARNATRPLTLFGITP
ncbi:ISAs1 family transposase [Amycolatopsis sp. NPDC049688]|uniref:ISAs1 family transposase n=1 Tax=Amycolatopsis sp. NPDC049688 TaxID=3154733 RepID=UPI00342DD86A